MNHSNKPKKRRKRRMNQVTKNSKSNSRSGHKKMTPHGQDSKEINDGNLPSDSIQWKTVPDEIHLLSLVMQSDHDYKPNLYNSNVRFTNYWLLNNLHPVVEKMQQEIKQHKRQFLGQLVMELRANRAEKKNIFADQSHNWYEWMNDYIYKQFDPLLRIHVIPNNNEDWFNNSNSTIQFNSDLSVSNHFITTLIKSIHCEQQDILNSIQNYTMSLHPFAIFIMQLCAMLVCNIHFEEVVDEYKRKKLVNILSFAKNNKLKLMIYKYIIFIEMDIIYRTFYRKEDDTWKLKLKKYFKQYTEWFDFNKTISKEMQARLSAYLNGSIA